MRQVAGRLFGQGQLRELAGVRSVRADQLDK